MTIKDLDEVTRPVTDGPPIRRISKKRRTATQVDEDGNILLNKERQKLRINKNVCRKLFADVDDLVGIEESKEAKNEELTAKEEELDAKIEEVNEDIQEKLEKVSDEKAHAKARQAPAYEGQKHDKEHKQNKEEIKENQLNLEAEKVKEDIRKKHPVAAMTVGNDKKERANTDPRITANVRQEILKINNATMKEKILGENNGEKQHEEEEIQKSQLGCNVEKVSEDIRKKYRTERTTVENNKKSYAKAKQAPWINADECQEVLSISNGTMETVLEENKGEKQEEQVKGNELDSRIGNDKILTAENKDEGGEDDKEVDISDFSFLRDLQF